jgi:hypothetical protein
MESTYYQMWNTVDTLDQLPELVPMVNGPHLGGWFTYPL